ncbi:MAG: polymer-forming cytoskeletal protein [Candidatus Hinthialibacter antarcticus]|nr:polymer-forming cytoskeletal protein [Candidatus Hinthialibacter antarcticus]
MSDFSFTEDDLETPIGDDGDLEEAEENPSRLGADVEMQGRLLVRRSLDMAGEYKGNLVSNSTVRILPTGKLNGDIDAFNVIVEGEAHVKMLARKKLEILKGGKFVGDLQIQPEVIVLSEFASFGKDDASADEFYKEYARKDPADKTKNAKKS